MLPPPAHHSSSTCTYHMQRLVNANTVLHAYVSASVFGGVQVSAVCRLPIPVCGLIAYGCGSMMALECMVLLTYYIANAWLVQWAV